MVQRYVWFDDIKRTARARVELRLPEPMVEALDELAKVNDVSRNALVAGILSYALDEQRRRRLRIEKVGAVRVTEAAPAETPSVVTVQDANPAHENTSRPPDRR